MFAVIQFPIADGRCFIEGIASGGTPPRLRRPDLKQLNWGPPPDYLRYFGRVVERKRGKLSAWTDERAFFRADRAIRFVDLQEHPLAADPVSLYAACAFRRFFSNGESVARVEIGMRAPSGGSVSGLTASQCQDLVTSFARLPTKVRAVGTGPSKTPVYHAPAALARQGNHLTRLYRFASAIDIPAEELAAQSPLVRSGLPLVVVEFERHEASDFPAHTFIADPAAIGGAQLGFAFVPFGKDDRVPTWFLRPGSADGERVRNLRLVLLRMHAQRQALNLILKLVEDKVIVHQEGTETGRLLETSLNAAMTIVEKPDTFGVSQPELWRTIHDAEEAEAALDAVSHTIDLAQGAIDREHLLARLTAAKGQLQRRVGAYADGMRPGIPNDPSGRLVDLLLRIPATEPMHGRSALLKSIPGTDGFRRDEGIRRLDLDLIVTQVRAIGPLDSGAQPLVILIDNALPFAAPGAAVYSELLAIRNALGPA